jgi:hypothetical protein
MHVSCLTPKTNPEDLDAFDTPAWSISTLDAQNLDVCDSLPEFYPIFRPANLCLILSDDGAGNPLVTPAPCLNTFGACQVPS